MLYTLKNEILKVTVSSLGAEIVSVKRGECEYIWQGNPEFWNGQAPILFPVCGRFFGGKYTYRGKEYEMGIHGFARKSEFTVREASENRIVFSLKQSEETLPQYPFDFELTVCYTLEGDKLSSAVNIKNTGDSVMPATFGAHPGFNVPLDGGIFEDWYIEFAENCTPNELILSDTCFNTGKKRAYPLENSRIIPLRHSLFDIDAVFMDKIKSPVTLKSDKSSRSVTLEYSVSDMPYLGLWHKPQSSAPYVCIEPWCGLPSYDGEIEDIEVKNDMLHISPSDEKTISYNIIFG